MWFLGVLQKKVSRKIRKEIPVLQSLLDTIKKLQAVRLPSLLKRYPRFGVSEPAVCRSSTKQVFFNNSQNSQENTYVGVTFLRKPCFTEHLQ